MIDLHAHVLPGIDDGAPTFESSLALARAAVTDGVETMVATPHVRDDYRTEATTMARLVDELRAAFASDSVPLELLPGGEVALDQVRARPVSELQAFGLGGNPGYLLVEFPYHGWPLDLSELMFQLVAQGVTPVLAHPERNDVIQAAPLRLQPLVASGCLVQLTAASAVGRLGRRPRAAAMQLLELGLAHVLASDAHAAGLPGEGLAAAAVAVGGGQLADWQTRELPGAIVAGSELPARPDQARSRRWPRVGRKDAVVTRALPSTSGLNRTDVGHLLFIWSPLGYGLREREGQPPAVGTTFDEDGRLLRVSRIGPSPLFGDRRKCAFTEPIPQ